MKLLHGQGLRVAASTKLQYTPHTVSPHTNATAHTNTCNSFRRFLRLLRLLLLGRLLLLLLLQSLCLFKSQPLAPPTALCCLHVLISRLIDLYTTQRVQADRHATHAHTEVRFRRKHTMTVVKFLCAPLVSRVAAAWASWLLCVLVYSNA